MTIAWLKMLGIKSQLPKMLNLMYVSIFWKQLNIVRPSGNTQESLKSRPETAKSVEMAKVAKGAQISQQAPKR